MSNRIKIIIVAACAVVVVTMIGIIYMDRSSLIGVWYSNEDDNSALVLRKDGTFVGGGGMGGGSYAIVDDIVTLIGLWDGTRTLNVVKVEGKTMLKYTENGHSYTYYNNLYAANTDREARKSAEEENRKNNPQAQEMAELVPSLKTEIIGYWSGSSDVLIFTEDGRLTRYNSKGAIQSLYSVKDNEKINVAYGGNMREESVKITEDGLMNFRSKQYIKTEPIELSENILEGVWKKDAEDDPVSITFLSGNMYHNKDGKSVASSYKIVDGNTMKMSDANGEVSVYVSGAGNQYHMFFDGARWIKEIAKQ